MIWYTLKTDGGGLKINPFVGPRILLCWPSGDGCSGFQSQDGYSHLCASLPADHLVASMAAVLLTHIRFQAVVGITHTNSVSF